MKSNATAPWVIVGIKDKEPTSTVEGYEAQALAEQIGASSFVGLDKESIKKPKPLFEEAIKIALVDTKNGLASRLDFVDSIIAGKQREMDAERDKVSLAIWRGLKGEKETDAAIKLREELHIWKECRNTLIEAGAGKSHGEGSSQCSIQ